MTTTATTTTPETTETTTPTTTTTRRAPKEVELSQKTTAWCLKVAKVALKRIFRVEDALETEAVDLNSVRFIFLPKILQRKHVGYTDRQSKIMLHPKFFDEKGNIRKKLPKELRDELKAAIFMTLTRFALGKRSNVEFYKTMVRCPWVGAGVDGAKGSPTEARQELSTRRQKKVANKRTTTEVATGLHEDVKMWSLTEGRHILVKDAEIFLANGNLKIARGEYNGKKLRTMLPGGADLKKKLNL